MQEAHTTMLHLLCELVDDELEGWTGRRIMAEVRTETMTVNMGPQHPSTHGVLRLVLELDGETVVSVSPTIGFLHTGIEKTAEQKKWQQVIPLVERMDYLGAQSNSLAYCLSVEKLLGIEVPQRVKDIRVLIAELQRISSHLVWFGTHGMEIGAITVMLYAFREREILMNLNEMLAGFRFFPSYIRVGGLREDIPRGFKEAVSAFLDRFPGKLDEYETLHHQEPDLARSHPRRRHHHAGRLQRRGGCSGRSPAPPAATTTCAAPSRTPATTPTSSTSSAPATATSTTATSRASPRCARASRSAARRSSASTRWATGRWPTARSRRRPRTRSTPRWKR